MTKTLIKTKVVRISEIQHQTLVKMKSYNIDIGKFVRDSISEKIKKEYKNLIPKEQKVNYPF